MGSRDSGATLHPKPMRITPVATVTMTQVGVAVASGMTASWGCESLYKDKHEPARDRVTEA